MIKIKNAEVNEVVKYGRITIETKLGDIEFSFATGSLEDYRVESGREIYNKLSNDESDELDDLLINKIREI